MSVDAVDDADAIQYWGYLWPGVNNCIAAKREQRVGKFLLSQVNQQMERVSDAAIAKRSESSSLAQAANSSPPSMVVFTHGLDVSVRYMTADLHRPPRLDGFKCSAA